MAKGYRMKGFMLASVLMATAALSACGNNGNNEANTAATNSTNAAATTEASTEPTTEAAAESPAADASKDEPLVVYLNDFDDIIKPMFEEKTGYKLEIVSGNGAEIASRIEAEKGNPHWDVVWMDSMPTIDQMGKNGQLLDSWQPSNLDGLTDFAKGLVPANNTYFPTGEHAASVIVYNTKAFDANSAPKTWDDLIDAKFKGAIGMADPAVAAPAYPFVAWFFQSEGMDQGKSYFDSLLKNGVHVYPKNPNVAKALTDGEIKAAALQESNAYTLKNAGEPVDIIWPAEGAPASVRVAAIQKESKHQEAAKAFVEFLLDPATQQALIDKGDESYFEPSVKGVNAKADRAADAKLVVAEAGWAGEHEGEIKQWFADKAVK
ncbi:iron(III) transport system substrate-binding protein [Paenibacillus catalpae]|uniref:Iron(III) transport system substrate-binding protein n=1 Tax=Paenibacillus catalpae TaxID=1045775 RepID=A0A1I2BU85_9BACL|nr:ABC transporter substrate-binding protein [Paenibacillus catalpae]SFE58870.1 iron(III) transport system substrate-binding protein [Paenibacillus catalpae]